MHSFEQRPLDTIAQWPVDKASAAVVTTSGVNHTFGDQTAVYPLASVTKLLVAYAALVAVEEGAIELDQQAGPEGSTVRHLLAHASGLAFGERTVQAPPETKRIYSSAGFEVLAQTIADESGIAFSDYVTEAVFAPLGMETAELVGSPGHGARACAADLSRFATELLRPTLIAPQTFEAATTVQYPGLEGLLPGYGRQRPNDWGLGFEIRGSKNPHWTGESNSPQTHGHFGQSGTFLWVDPVVETVVVVLTDRDFGDWAKPLWPDLSDRVVGMIQAPSQTS